MLTTRMMVDTVSEGKEAADTILPLLFEVRTTQDSGSGVILLTVETAVKGATVALTGIDS